jgi:arabinofuranosyltransferase
MSPVGAGLKPGPGHFRSPWFWLAFIALLCILVVGWKLFWFLTDDAFITFRYASNSILGYGYTWNPPPFRPVEGYTNFLWLLLLEFVWRTLGVEPPDSANILSLGFAMGTLVFGALIGLRMKLTGAGVKLRYPLVFIALFAAVTNRTFLAWSSSGLETALFTFLLTAWIFFMLNPTRNLSAWVFLASLLSSLTYLTRPDGLLVVFGTLFLLLWKRVRAELTNTDVSFALPLLIVPAHFLWRKSYYGLWFPNTFYAKYVAAWPESGIRYVLSFCMEYSLWVWLLLAGAFLWKAARGLSARRPGLRMSQLIVTAVIAGHFSYYTFVVGGDYFEYRVYNHLILLLFISSVWLADRVFTRSRAAVGTMVLFVLLSYPIPWAHWHASKDLNTREQTKGMVLPVAPYFPWPMNYYVSVFDDLQRWLMVHMVCVRHQEHKVTAEFQLGRYPTREEGMAKFEPGNDVTYKFAVGIIGWVMPHTAIIDIYGLNDYVVARTPSPAHSSIPWKATVEASVMEREPQLRRMAHEHIALKDYVACFRPNLYVTRDGKTGRLQFHRDAEREAPTREEIIDCEETWWAWANAMTEKTGGGSLRRE